MSSEAKMETGNESYLELSLNLVSKFKFSNGYLSLSPHTHTRARAQQTSYTTFFLPSGTLATINSNDGVQKCVEIGTYTPSEHSSKSPQPRPLIPNPKEDHQFSKNNQLC